MVTYIISEDCVALFLAPGQLHDMEALVRFCLVREGLEPWDRIEGELFDRGDGLLLIARPLPPLLRRLDDNFPRLRRCHRR